MGVRRVGWLGALVLVVGAAGVARGDVLDDELASAKAALEAGKALEAQSKLTALGEKVEGLLKEKPADGHLNYVFGSVCMYLGDDDVARKALDTAVKVEPKNAEFVLARGTLAMYEEKYEEAITQFKRALALGSTGAATWAQLGDAQMQAKQTAEALASYQHAVEMNAKESRYLGRVGGALMALGKNDEAVAAYRKALEIDPKYVVAWANIGQIEQTRGHAEAALEAYEKLLAVTPEDWRALAKEVQLYEALGKAKERDAAREKIIALWKAKQISDKAFCREIFGHGANQVMVFEYFNLGIGDDVTVYDFAILKADGKTIERRAQLSVLGQGKNVTTWRLTIDSESGQELLAGPAAAPTYEEVRKLVVDYLDGKLKAISVTSRPMRPPPGGERSGGNWGWQMSEDGLARCGWSSSALMSTYHDQEWGVPLHDDLRLFEFLVLEGAQAGLSWSTILNKRENYRKAFEGFEPARVSRYGAKEVKRLLGDAGIVRNRLKVGSAIENAKAFLKVQEEFGSFDVYIWRFVKGRPIQNKWKTMKQIPAKSKESDAMSKDLKTRGFKFVGSTICYAHMQATGMVNDHIVTCHRHEVVKGMAGK